MTTFIWPERAKINPMSDSNELVTEPNMPKLYVVVCTDLHVAFGPYADPQEALFKASRLTSVTECTYAPVLLQLDQESQGVVAGVHTYPAPDDWRKSHHGYL